ncbi:hypothetical protein EUX98_g4590 [Antrodiella citrinella]|uniref:Uncharacterized protein n=1 Tax=Antrodiella citrinella TaxID=2447956 RepID=A0A4S4N1L2_9APHY|nr:hypothetical protein EUX98_g4590 [Antrodiella citrinella]
MDLTPAGLAFAILILLAMLLGVAAAIWHSWLAPYLLRKRLLTAQNDPEKGKCDDSPTAEKAFPNNSPDLDLKEVATPQNSPTAGDPDPAQSTLTLTDDGTLAGSFSKLLKEGDEGEGELDKPKPTYCADRRIRFSGFSATAPERDLPWWFF